MKDLLDLLLWVACFDEDPDPTFHSDADPDPGLDPTPSFKHFGKSEFFSTFNHSNASIFLDSGIGVNILEHCQCL